MEFYMNKSIKIAGMSLALSTAFLFQTVAAKDIDSGIIKVKSNTSVEETVKRLVKVLGAKGMTVFNTIDHAKGAAKVGLSIAPTQVVIFGNPKIGTLLMQCAPQSAIDLPQKALIQQDTAGDVWLSYNTPSYIGARHSMQGCDKVIDKVTNALANFAKAATQS